MSYQHHSYVKQIHLDGQYLYSPDNSFINAVFLKSNVKVSAPITSIFWRFFFFIQIFKLHIQWMIYYFLKISSFHPLSLHTWTFSYLFFLIIYVLQAHWTQHFFKRMDGFVKKILAPLLMTKTCLINTILMSTRSISMHSTFNNSIPRNAVF